VYPELTILISKDLEKFLPCVCVCWNCLTIEDTTDRVLPYILDKCLYWKCIAETETYTNTVIRKNFKRKGDCSSWE